MTDNVVFEPRWASAPGETILQALYERGQSVDDLAEWLGLSDPQTRRLLTGAARIDNQIARALALHLGGSEGFWIARESRYLEQKLWVSADSLAAKLPVKDLIKRGWIKRSTSWRERAKDCLEFFGVTSEEEYDSLYGNRLANAHFRRSATLKVNNPAVAAWLRRAEIESQAIDTADWSAAVFRQSLPGIRDLTKTKNPEVFIPKLQALCAAAGVALVVLATPPECPVSGAALYTRDDVPMIVLSARYRSDDHFWFTFFHEAGHLLLHDVAASPFLDELGPEGVDRSSTEVEADEFARSTLIDDRRGTIASGRSSGPTMREIIAYADMQGVAPGIIVGQLQHDGVFGFDRSNYLKRKYRWDGATLRSA
jgi:HTH-type transcriptional regulator/antitoxin HigA